VPHQVKILAGEVLMSAEDLHGIKGRGIRGSNALCVKHQRFVNPQPHFKIFHLGKTFHCRNYCNLLNYFQAVFHLFLQIVGDIEQMALAMVFDFFR
jgi:hypothetical protein